MDQRDLLFGVSRSQIGAWCGVDRTTAGRWKRGQSRAPDAALRLVALRVSGDAGALLGAAWAGWTFGRDGLLYAPGYRRGWSPGEILAIPYLYASLAYERRRQIGEPVTLPTTAFGRG